MLNPMGGVRHTPLSSAVTHVTNEHNADSEIRISLYVINGLNILILEVKKNVRSLASSRYVYGKDFGTERTKFFWTVECWQALLWWTEMHLHALIFVCKHASDVFLMPIYI